MITSLYCETTECKHHNGSGCGLDYTTIIDGECKGFENK